jgi:structural maintenance of chromosome 4
VGPNGSGKSNVIDSLLFVFGFRASKMRHTKISSLIHSSSSQPNCTSCSVEVHFQDVLDSPDGTTVPVEGSELVVSRKAFKNNSSRYFINDSESNFTDVTTLLRNRGIDLDHKRFLILQGEVESISQMKAKAENDSDDGLLEYLEDIIGTSDYKKAIEESQAQVETLNDDCAEKSNRLQIVEKELNNLEGTKNEIIHHLEIENELTMKRSALLQLYIYVCNKRIQLSNNVIEEQQTKLQQELEKTSTNKDQVDQLKQDHKTRSKELDGMKKKVQEMSKKLSKHEIEKVQVEEKKKHLDSKRKKLERAIETAQHTRNESQTWLDSYVEETDRLKNQVSELEKSLKKETAALESIQEQLKDKTQVFTDEIEKIQRELEPWRSKISEKESEIEVAQSQVDILRERAASAQASLDESKEKMESIKNQGRRKERDLEGLKEEQERVGSQIELGTTECGSASEKLEKMKKKLSAMQQHLSSARESASSAKSQNKVLAGLTKLSNSGRIEGFHGRLGGLGTIDQKYDVAVSTACPALDNIVVDTVETGQQCVEYLRKNNLGRANFILLNRLPKRDLSPIETPENVPRLFDLVKPQDDKFAPAFFSVMTNTLVAKDAEQARRIAYGKKRFRVVALDGTLIDTSGTMSGGGNTKKSGAMKDKIEESVSEDTIKEMEDEVTAYEERVQLAESKYSEMDNALRELKERKPQVELEISKTELEIQTLTKSLQDAHKQHKELVAEGKKEASAAAAVEKELKEAEKVVTQKQGELEDLKAQTKDLEQRIADLQEKIMDAGGVNLRMQKSKVDSIKEQMELCNTRLSNGVMDRTKAENEVKKQTRTIESSEKEIVESEEENERLGSTLKEMIGLVSQLETEVESANDVVEEKQEALDELKAELDEKQKQIDSIRSVELEIKNTIEQHQKSLKDDNHARSKWQEQLANLSLHNIAELKSLRTNSNKSAESKKAPEQGAEAEEEQEEPEQGEPEGEPEEKDDQAQPAEEGDDPNRMEEDGPEGNTEEQEAHLFEYSADELAEMDKEALKQEIAELEELNENAKIDMQVLKDYKRRVEEYESRKSVLNEAVASRDAVKKQCDDLRQRRLDEFMTGFNAISLKLKEMYQMITMGGNAELELVDSLDPFSEGIIFSVMPPKKSWRNISNLSGGEKTLSSLALVFALHHYKPTPLYVMDEIDAALDFRNVSIVATYINERTKNGQFIVISLRNNMFELARQLVGIYKVNNMTKSIALENKNFLEDENQ